MNANFFVHFDEKIFCLRRVLRRQRPLGQFLGVTACRNAYRLKNFLLGHFVSLTEHGRGCALASPTGQARNKKTCSPVGFSSLHPRPQPVKATPSEIFSEERNLLVTKLIIWRDNLAVWLVTLLFLLLLWLWSLLL